MHQYYFIIQVNSAWERGDSQSAKSNSRSAFFWNIMNIVSGVLIMVLIAVLVGIIYPDELNDSQLINNTTFDF